LPKGFTRLRVRVFHPVSGVFSSLLEPLNAKKNGIFSLQNQAPLLGMLQVRSRNDKIVVRLRIGPQLLKPAP